MNLRDRIQEKITQLGVVEGAKFFNCSESTIRAWKRTLPGWVDSVQSFIGTVAPEMNGHAVDAPLIEEEVRLWEGKQVFIAQPVYYGMEPANHFTLLANYNRYGVDRIGILQEEGTCIWRQRSKLLKRALEHPDMREVIFVDSDLVLPTGKPEHFNHYGGKMGWPDDLTKVAALPRILSHPSEIGVVGAIYRDRKGGHRMMVGDAMDNKATNDAYDRFEFRGLRKVNWVATGFMRIPRWVIERLYELTPELWPDLIPKKDGSAIGLFEPLRVGQGEDVAFCIRCAQAGIGVWADCNIFPKHVGKSYN